MRVKKENLFLTFERFSLFVSITAMIAVLSMEDDGWKMEACQ